MKFVKTDTECDSKSLLLHSVGGEQHPTKLPLVLNDNLLSMELDKGHVPEKKFRGGTSNGHGGKSDICLKTPHQLWERWW